MAVMSIYLKKNERSISSSHHSSETNNWPPSLQWKEIISRRHDKVNIIVEAAILQEIYAYLGQEENSQTNSEISMLICPKGLKLMMKRKGQWSWRKWKRQTKDQKGSKEGNRLGRHMTLRRLHWIFFYWYKERKTLKKPSEERGCHLKNKQTTDYCIIIFRPNTITDTILEEIR